MANWGYSASWGNDYGMSGDNTHCDAPGFDDNLLKYNKNSIRMPLYVIETDYSKEPSESTLGSVEGIKEKGNTFNNNSKGTSKDGHVSRNIRICLALLDMTIPSIWDIKELKEQDGLHVKWMVHGALKVDETYIQYEYTDDKGATLTKKTEVLTGEGKWGEAPTTFEAIIPTTATITYKATAKVDTVK